MNHPHPHTVPDSAIRAGRDALPRVRAASSGAILPSMFGVRYSMFDVFRVMNEPLPACPFQRDGRQFSLSLGERAGVRGKDPTNSHAQLPFAISFRTPMILLPPPPFHSCLETEDLEPETRFGYLDCGGRAKRRHRFSSFGVERSSTPQFAIRNSEFAIVAHSGHRVFRTPFLEPPE